MEYSIIKKSECSKYDFGHFLFSPEFFLNDKLKYWQILAKNSEQLVQDCFFHIRETVNKIDEEVICYDLTDGLSKFFDNGVETNHIKSTKKIANENDFVISRLRSYLEEMGIVEQRDKKQLLSTEFLVFREKIEHISTYTLFAMCMTKIVQTILNRGQYGTGHPRCYDFLLTHLPIPNCLFLIDSHIKKVIQSALEIRKSSRKIYKEAQTLLLSELGLTNWQPKHQLSFIKNHSDTEQAGRIDAEYYQPKYEEIINAIKCHAGGWDRLKNLNTLKNKNYTPKDKQTYKYIELSDIFGNGEIIGCTIEKGQELPSRARRKVTTGDVIVSSIEGSLSNIALIIDEYNQALCSTGFHVINSDLLNPETLLVLLKSIVGQLQLKKGCSGTILTAINKDEFSKVILPILSIETQTKIQQRVIESFALREQSKHLLECAKRAVEIAIEQNEETAIDWLEEKTRTIEGLKADCF